MSRRDDQEPDDQGYGEASRYAAHIDRGWSLLAREQFSQARSSAAHASRINPHIPDAAMLLAAVSLAEGDSEDALEWYEHALEIDGEYVDAHLAAIQVRLYDLRDAAGALAHVERASAVVEAYPVDHFDLELFALEALTSTRSLDAAAARLDALEDLDDLVEILGADASEEALAAELRFLGPVRRSDEPDDEPDDGPDDGEDEHRIERCIILGIRATRICLDLGRNGLALALARVLVARRPEEADAWHLLGEAEHASGDLCAAVAAALRTAALDSSAEPSPGLPPLETLRALVISLLERGPMRRVCEHFAAPQVAVLMHESPAPELVLEGVDPRVIVLALGVREALGPGDEDLPPRLTGIAVYRRNLAAVTLDPELLERELDTTLREEVAGYLGLDQGWRRSLGLPGGAESAPAEPAPASSLGVPAPGIAPDAAASAIAPPATDPTPARPSESTLPRKRGAAGAEAPSGRDPTAVPRTRASSSTSPRKKKSARR